MASVSSLSTMFNGWRTSRSSSSSCRLRTRSSLSSMCSRSTLLVIFIKYNDRPVYLFSFQTLLPVQTTYSLSCTSFNTLPTLPSITHNQDKLHPQQVSPYHSHNSFSSTQSNYDTEDILDTAIAVPIATPAVVGAANTLPQLSTLLP
jgi:hypothetical protein